MNWTSILPRPVCDEHPEFLKLYDFAWQCAHDHIVDFPGMPQTPFMDEAFCPEFLWIWDTCFMALFCKYAQREFPGYQSLMNFYEPLHGTKQLPFLTVENALDWNYQLSVNNIKQVNPNVQIMRVSAKTEEGLDNWINFLVEKTK